MMEQTHAPINVGEKEILVEKEFANTIQEQIDSVVTLGTLLNYNVVIESEKFKPDRWVVEFRKRGSILSSVSITFGLKNNIPFFLSTEYGVVPNTVRSNCNLKYKKFVKCLEELPKKL